MFNTKGVLYPDSVVGTDSHTTMIDGLGVAGWGVGGIEAEATMLGQVIIDYQHYSRLMLVNLKINQILNRSLYLFDSSSPI